MLKIYNSLSQTKLEFTPLEKNKIKLYACGITVYDYCHLGHGRQMVTFDFLVRYLRYRGYEVDFVRNITDIDDKIIARANENGETCDALTARFIQAMYEDGDALNTMRPDKEPKATEYIPQIVAMIQTLIDKGFAYAADNGDVYYNVAKFGDYGCLSHQDIDAMQAGSRVEINTAKQSPLDFVLWKAAKSGEPAWDSPWSQGRPGWHIECSAMSTNELGNHFDIHGGGLDLKFPHHENEIAQSEAATGEKFVNTWLHTGLIQVDNEKMSKSLGNFTTIREALTEYRPEEIRYFMLASHYRSPISYSSSNMQSATAALTRFYTALRDVTVIDELDDNHYEARFTEAMDDDFNTPEALAVLFELVREINRVKSGDTNKASQLAALLIRLGDVLGILQDEPVNFLQDASDVNVTEIETLITAREQARANKDWAESDRIRDELTAIGITIEDGSEGTKWRKA
jgi:cysteinyl-tRNA synthetase